MFEVCTVFFGAHSLTRGDFRSHFLTIPPTKLKCQYSFSAKAFTVKHIICFLRRRPLRLQGKGRKYIKYISVHHPTRSYGDPAIYLMSQVWNWLTRKSVLMRSKYQQTQQADCLGWVGTQFILIRAITLKQNLHLPWICCSCRHCAI